MNENQGKFFFKFQQGPGEDFLERNFRDLFEKKK